jgi:hypothetical protein
LEELKKKSNRKDSSPLPQKHQSLYVRIFGEEQELIKHHK